MPDGVAVVEKSTFRRSCAISVVVRASPERVWSLLTDSASFPQWNSTVTKIEGPIALGQKLKITVPISTRTFTPTVVDFAPQRTMTWADGQKPMFQGVRVYTLEPGGPNATRFSMKETFSGVMLPLIGGTLPDFAPIFERYAADLKAAAERS